MTLAAERAGWGKKLQPGRGMGMAVWPYGNSYCAVVAEVTVQNGALTIDKLTIGVDCGKVVNPSGASNQITGGIVWSLTALLTEACHTQRPRCTHKLSPEQAIAHERMPAP